MWPPVIQDTLHMLIEDELSLKESPEYDEFIRGLSSITERPAQEN